MLFSLAGIPIIIPLPGDENISPKGLLSRDRLDGLRRHYCGADWTSPPYGVHFVFAELSWTKSAGPFPQPCFAALRAERWS
jgi:hypothetical protein